MFTDNYRLVRLGMAEAHRAAEQERAHRRRHADEEPYVVAKVDVTAATQSGPVPAPAPSQLPGAALATAVECGPCEASHQAA